MEPLKPVYGRNKMKKYPKYRIVKHTVHYKNHENVGVYYTIDKLKRFLFWTYWSGLCDYDDCELNFRNVKDAKRYIKWGESFVKRKTKTVN